MDSKTPRTDVLDQGLYGYSDYRRTMPQVLALARALELEAAALRERGPSVVAFGAPRVGNGVFAGWFRQAVPDCRRVVLPGDLVPLVPPHPYIHVPSLLRLPRSGPDLRPEHDRGEYRKALSTIE